MTHRLSDQLLRVGPHAGAHRVAVRAAVSVAVPLLVLEALGHLEWSIYATFGAFASLYGRNQAHPARVRMQSTLAVLLTCSMVLGSAVGLSEDRSWWAVPATAAVAALGSLLSDARAWHPPGPLFLVFSFAACASVPREPSDLAVAALVGGCSAAFAVLVGAAGSAVRRVRGGAAALPPDRRSGPRSAVARLHVARTAGGVLAAGTVATASGVGHPYWAMVSAVVPMAAPTRAGQLLRGAHRVAGTAVGLALSAVLLALEPRGALLIAVIVALQVAAELFVGRNYGLALVFITPLALLLGEIVVQHPSGSLLFQRGVETVIGVVVAVVVTLLVRERSDGPVLPPT
jgi:hypothetical protein